jgi:hypothetical protein
MLNIKALQRHVPPESLPTGRDKLFGKGAFARNAGKLFGKLNYKKIPAKP